MLQNADPVRADADAQMYLTCAADALLIAHGIISAERLDKF